MQLLFKPKKNDPNSLRDRLANERTYLAWMRTAISLMEVRLNLSCVWGFCDHLFYLHRNGWKSGLAFAGILTVWLSTQPLP